MRTLFGLIAIAVLLSATASAAEDDARMSTSKGDLTTPHEQAQSGGCRHPDGYVAIGQTACIDVCGDRYLARCGMVLNNTAWKRIKDGCDPAEELSSLGLAEGLVERLAKLVEPPVDPLLVHAQVVRPVN